MVVSQRRTGKADAAALPGGGGDTARSPEADAVIAAQRRRAGEMDWRWVARRVVIRVVLVTAAFWAYRLYLEHAGQGDGPASRVLAERARAAEAARRMFDK